MKKYILLLITLTFFFSLNSYSQERLGKDRFKALKIGFITETLDLSVEEAEKFWPIYNKYSGENHKLRTTLKNLTKERSLNDDEFIERISEENAEELLNRIVDINKKIYENEQNLFTNLKGVLSAKRLLKLHRVEHEFKRKILEQFKRRRKERRMD